MIEETAHMDNKTTGSTRSIVFHSTTNLDVVQKNIAKLHELGINDRIYVFAKSFASSIDGIDGQIDFPEHADTSPKQKNFILDWFKGHEFKGFLHIIEDSIIVNDNTRRYMDKLESAMAALDYDVHFSTATDRCNYVFNKLCPRLTLDVDDQDMKQKLGLPDKICFMSHSNVSYVTYNFGNVGDCPPKFDERFTIGMFYIIEFLARRRATKANEQLYYMNQYLSISDEVDGYSILQDIRNKDDDSSKMNDENELFKSLNIDYAPDNNIDIVLECLYAKLKKKIA